MCAHVQKGEKFESAPGTEWQPQLSRLLAKLKSQDDYREFRRLKTDYRRVLFCAKRNFLMEIGMKWKNDGLNEKSKKEAVELRNLGNKHFQKERYRDALLKYNESILKAPRDDESLAVGYANRSAISFHKKEYKLALRDIALSLESGYPDNLVYKIYKRRGKCFECLGNYSEAKQAYYLAQVSLKKYQTQLNPNRKDAIAKELNQLLKEAESKPDEVTDEKNGSSVYIPKLSYNEILPAATSRIKVKLDAKSGRSLVANDVLYVGDNLIIEEPYVSTQLSEFERKNCHHCYMKTTYPVPCIQCSRVAYCSTECQLESWQQYHYVECKILYILYETGVAHISSRLIIKTGEPYLRKFQEELKTRSADAIPGFSEDGRYLNDFQTIYDLMTHSDKLHIDDLFYYSMTALLMLNLLKRNGFFVVTSEPIMTASKNDPAFKEGLYPIKHMVEQCRIMQENPNFTDFELFVGGLILRNLQQLICNAQAITDVLPDEAGDDDLGIKGGVCSVSEKKIGAGIYPTASLMNHSCEPSVFCSYQGKKLIVRCLKKLQKGDDIFNCYGPHFKRMDIEVRREVLRDQYFFECQCTACANNISPDTLQSLACTKCSGPIVNSVCKECKQFYNKLDLKKRNKKTVRPMEEARRLCQQNNFIDALDVLKKNYKYSKNSFYKYNHQLAEYEDMIAQVYMKSGPTYNSEKAIKHIHRALAIVENIYGRRSIEYGKELKDKFVPMLLSAKQFPEYPQALEEAFETLGYYYPENHPDIIKLDSDRHIFHS